MCSSRLFTLGCLLSWLGAGWSQYSGFSGVSERCSLPPDRRPCTPNGSVRFYFDTETLRCSSFLFRGCHTQGNNFRSQVECLHTCLMRHGDDLIAPPEAGRGYIQLDSDDGRNRWYSTRDQPEGESWSRRRDREDHRRRYPSSSVRYFRQADEQYLPPSDYGPYPRRVESKGDSGYPRREMYEYSPLEYEYRRPDGYGWYREGIQDSRDVPEEVDDGPPIRPPVPPVPKDGSPPRGNGWFVTRIPGGFRAIKDDRRYNGWRHTYSRVFRTHPEGIAGTSFWSMVSEFDPNYNKRNELVEAEDERKRQEAIIYNRITREPHIQDPEDLMHDSIPVFQQDTHTIHGALPYKHNAIQPSVDMFPVNQHYGEYSKLRHSITQVRLDIPKQNHVNFVSRNNSPEKGTLVRAIPYSIRIIPRQSIRRTNIPLPLHLTQGSTGLWDILSQGAIYPSRKFNPRGSIWTSLRNYFKPRVKQVTMAPYRERYVFVSRGADRFSLSSRGDTRVEETPHSVWDKYRIFSRSRVLHRDTDGIHDRLEKVSSPEYLPNNHLIEQRQLFVRGPQAGRSVSDFIYTPPRSFPEKLNTGFIHTNNRIWNPDGYDSRQNILQNSWLFHKYRNQARLYPRIRKYRRLSDSFKHRYLMSESENRMHLPIRPLYLYPKESVMNAMGIPKMEISSFTSPLHIGLDRLYKTKTSFGIPSKYSDKIIDLPFSLAPRRYEIPAPHKIPSYLNSDNVQKFGSFHNSLVVDTPFDPVAEIEAGLDNDEFSNEKLQPINVASRPLLAYGMHQQQSADSHRLMAVRRPEGVQFEPDARDTAEMDFRQAGKDIPVLERASLPMRVPDMHTEIVDPRTFEDGHGLLPENIELESDRVDQEEPFSGDSHQESENQDVQETELEEHTETDNADEALEDDTLGVHPDAPAHIEPTELNAAQHVSTTDATTLPQEGEFDEEELERMTTSEAQLEQTNAESASPNEPSLNAVGVEPSQSPGDEKQRILSQSDDPTPVKEDLPVQVRIHMQAEMPSHGERLPHRPNMEMEIERDRIPIPPAMPPRDALRREISPPGLMLPRQEIATHGIRSMSPQIVPGGPPQNFQGHPIMGTDRRPIPGSQYARQHPSAPQNTLQQSAPVRRPHAPAPVNRPHMPTPLKRPHLPAPVNRPHLPAPVSRPHPPAKMNPCLLPPDPGPCRAMLQRWYFNSKQGRCMLLIFGGCHGNANNFISKEECQDICKDKFPAATAETPPVTEGRVGYVKLPGPPAPPSKQSSTNPWPGFLHLYSRLLVSTLSRFNNRLRPEATTKLPHDVVTAGEKDVFTSTTDKNPITDQEDEVDRYLTTPKPDGEGEGRATEVNAEDDIFDGLSDEGSESGEVDDFPPARPKVEFTPSPQDVDSEGQDGVDMLPPGFRAPWALPSGKPRHHFPGHRGQSMGMGRNRYHKFWGNLGNNKNKGLTLMQVFVHKNEPGRISYPMGYPRNPNYQMPMYPSSPPRYPPIYPAWSGFRNRQQHQPDRDFLLYTMWRQQQLQQAVERAYMERTEGPGEANLACLQPLDTAFCPVGQPQLRWYFNQKTARCEIFFFGGCGRGNYNRFTTQAECQSTCMTTSPGPAQYSTSASPRHAPVETTTIEEKDATTLPPTTVAVHTEETSSAEEPAISGGDQEEQTELYEPMRLEYDVEYGSVIAILTLGAVALLVLVALCALYIMRKWRKTETPKREKVVEAVLKAHLCGGMPSLPYKMPPPTPVTPIVSATGGTTAGPA